MANPDYIRYFGKRGPENPISWQGVIMRAFPDLTSGDHTIARILEKPEWLTPQSKEKGDRLHLLGVGGRGTLFNLRYYSTVGRGKGLAFWMQPLEFTPIQFDWYGIGEDRINQWLGIRVGEYPSDQLIYSPNEKMMGVAAQRGTRRFHYTDTSFIKPESEALVKVNAVLPNGLGITEMWVFNEMLNMRIHDQIQTLHLSVPVLVKQINERSIP